MPSLSELSPDELKARLMYECEKYKEVWRQADRDDAWLYAQNLDFIAEMEAEDEPESGSDD